MADTNTNGNTEAPVTTQVAQVQASDMQPCQGGAQVEGQGDGATSRRVEKPEPMNILVRDQTGAGLQFKVRKNTKFERVMTAFCQKKKLDPSQVRFLYEGERIREFQTPESVDMSEGDILDCVIEQLGGNHD